MSKSSRPRKKVVPPGRSGLSFNAIVTIAVVGVVLAVIAAVLLINRSGSGGKDADELSNVIRKPDSNTLSVASDNKVTLVEFLDFQCGSCGGFYSNITKKLEQDYSGKITFVTRNFPLDMHPLAIPAARAAEAAAAQGKYSQMYHALYDNQEKWAQTAGGGVNNDTAQARGLFVDYARAIGLDVDKFNRDMDSAEIAKRVDNDIADGKEAEVTGTPTFFINGERFEPKGDSYADVDRQLRKQLDRQLKR